MEQLLDKWQRLLKSEYLRPDEKLMLNHCIADLKRFMGHEVDVNEMVGNRTAVEWLIKKLESTLINTTGDYKVKLIIGLSDIKQAKEMEKEQIIEAYQQGITDEHGDTITFSTEGEDYYNQTYGGNK